MVNRNRFDAALRAHVFHRTFVGGDESGNHAGGTPRDEAGAPRRPPDLAAELATALARDLNAPAAGLRPLPRRLLPDRPSSAPSAAAAEEAKSVSLTAALRQLPPATLAAGFETVEVGPRAPPPKPTSAPRPVAVTSGEAGSPAASAEQPAGTPAMPAGEASKMADHAAEARPTPRYHDATRPPVSFAVDPCDEDKTAQGERLEWPSAAELAKRYAPQPSAAASAAQEGRSMPEARANDGGNIAPIRWQAGDETPPGWFLRSPRGVNRTRKAAAVAIVLAGAIGGVGMVVTLESLAAPQPVPGVAAADPMHTRPSDNEPSAAVTTRSLGKMTPAARVPASRVEVILAGDTGNGLALAERTPLPSFAKVIPLPQPVPASVDLRPSKDAGDGGHADDIAAMDSRDVSAAPSVDAAQGGVAVDEPVADPVEATADGGDAPAAPAPRAPTPRPDHRGSPEGVLAYAPAADLVDRRTKVVASKASDKPAAKRPKPGPARVVSWVSWVNLHASADNKAPTVIALPAGSTVTIVKCKYWCEVVADGKRGFVLKSFLTTIGADRLRDRGGSAFGNPYLKSSS